MKYTDPTTGLIYVTTDDPGRPESPAELRAKAEGHILAIRGEISERNKEILDETYPIPKFSDIDQGMINTPEPVDLARFNDHTYWAAHKSEFDAAIRDGSFN